MSKKPFRFILAVVFMAALATSCGKDSEDEKEGEKDKPHTPLPNNTCTVTFIGENESTSTQTILCGGEAKEPKKPPEKLEPGLYVGTPPAYRFDGWFADGATVPFDFDTPIGADTSLRARWTLLSSSSTLVAEVAANNVAAAIEYVNATPGEYTLVLDADVEISNTQTLDRADVQLTIVGARQERSILANNLAAELFRIDKIDATLRLGKNITLKQKNLILGTAVQVNDGKLVMLDGSKITGFTRAVSLAESATSIRNFTMEGGEITGNKDSGNQYWRVGGIHVGGGSTFHMRGGRVSGNFSAFPTPDTPADVFIGSSSAIAEITLSDKAVIGALSLRAMGGMQRPIITIGTTYSGEVSKLHLLGDPNHWTYSERAVIQAETGTLTANDIAKFGLGEFRTEPGSPPISLNHEIAVSGFLVAK